MSFYSGNAGELGRDAFREWPWAAIIQETVVDGATATGGDAARTGPWDFPEDVGRGTSTGGWHQRDWLYAGFAQDDWRVTDNLTLNLGLRYEARTPWTEINNRQVGVNILTGALEFPGNTPVPAGAVGTNGFSSGLYKTDYGLPDFQPRIGFAWSPTALGGKTVIRGAFTISSYLEGTGTNLRLTQNPPFTPPQVEASNVATGTGYSTETGFSSAAPPAGNPFIGATMLAWSGTVQPAVADQWNLSVQHELANNTTVPGRLCWPAHHSLDGAGVVEARRSAAERHGHLSLYRREEFRERHGTATAIWSESVRQRKEHRLRRQHELQRACRRCCRSDTATDCRVKFHTPSRSA